MVKALLSTLALALGLGSAPASAENFALLYTIGRYKRPDIAPDLPGVDLDAEMAQKMALMMGVPPSNITRLSDAAVTREAFLGGLDRIARRIGRGDNVFIYFSGHGAQVAGATDAKCAQGPVTYDVRLVSDQELKVALLRIAAKAGQLVVLNDSCYSGGASGLSKRADTDEEVRVSKATSLGNEGSRVAAADYRCGEAVNKAFRDMASTPEMSRIVYVAASRDDEVAAATSRGSAATRAWLHCLGDPRTDRDRSGRVTGSELVQCAQGWLESQPKPFNQHVQLVGEDALPLAFAPKADTPTAPAPAAMLADLRSTASPSIGVTLAVTPREMRIRQDELRLRITSNRPGYLYVLHAGTDGSDVTFLYPNPWDGNNRIEAGTVELPRGGTWRVRAAGPQGTSHVIAIVTETPLRAEAGKSTTSFATCSGDACLKTLVSEAAAPGRYGASELLSVREVPSQ